MALDPNLKQQELLAETLQSPGSAMSRQTLWIEISVAIGFVGAVAALWLVDPPHRFAVAPAAACVLVLALSSRVRFDMPFGFTVPTQLAFVPLLFAMPVVLVPIAVVVGLLISGLPEVLRKQTKPGRLLLMVGNSWFALGPVAVFALSGTEPRHAGVALLGAALLAQFAVDFAASTVRFAVGRGARLREQLVELWVYAIDAGLSGVGLVIAEAIRLHPIAVLAPVPLLAIFGVLARERHQRLEALLELNAAYRGTALVLGDVVEADDGYTGVHSRSVVALALAVGDAIGLGPEQRRDLEFAALLHDVGKITIPKEIIHKAGELEPEEWALLRAHAVEGQKMLDRVGGFMRRVGQIVRSHHERWDGEGYPDGLIGTAIPLETRIITCCDAWNAMRTDRTYRKALSHDAAVAELEVNAGSQFDPAIVRLLLAIVPTPVPAAAGALLAAGPRRPDPGTDTDTDIDIDTDIDTGTTEAPWRRRPVTTT